MVGKDCFIEEEKEREERRACLDQMRPLASQPFEQQREALLNIESQVRAIVGNDSEGILYHIVKPHSKELRMLLLKRYLLLGWMFKETPEAYERMRMVNQHFYDMGRQLREQMAAVCANLVEMPKAYFDDFEIKGVLGFHCDGKDSVLPMSLDKEYGSDYPLMMSVNDCLLHLENPNRVGNPYFGRGVEYGCSYRETKESILHDDLDDGVSWAHELHTGTFEGICVCHTTAIFVRDLKYPVFDLLHMNDFWTEILVGYQHWKSENRI